MMRWSPRRVAVRKDHNAKVDLRVHVGLFGVWKQLDVKAHSGAAINARIKIGCIGTAHPDDAGRKAADGRFVAPHGNPELFQVIGALHPPRGLACRLHCWQQQ